jgi:hypothetical protein
MAAKKKKTATKTYGNKTKFVLGLPRDLSAKQVVDEAKKQGITITEAHVYKIRSTAKTKTPKSASGKGGGASRASGSKAGTSSSQSKRDFVLSFGPDTKASEILKKAKDAGIGLSKAYLYTIRSAGGASQKRGRKPGAVSAPALSSGRAAGRGRASGAASGLEAQFIDAAIDLGLSKAGDLLQRLRARLKDF